MNSTIQKINIINDKLLTIGLLPSSYLVSMTYEEQLLWFCNYLENTLIPKLNELITTFNTDTETLENAINGLIDLAEELRQEMDDLDKDVDKKLEDFMDELSANLEVVADAVITEKINNGEFLLSIGTNYDDTTETLEFFIQSEGSSEVLADLESLTTPTEGGE